MEKHPGEFIEAMMNFPVNDDIESWKIPISYFPKSLNDISIKGYFSHPLKSKCHHSVG